MTAEDVVAGTTRHPRVVVVGGGFGGINATRALVARGAVVTLVDRHNYHLFQPLLYQVATSGLNPADIAYPLRGIFHRGPRVDVRVAEVVDADLDARTVVLGDGATLSYDHLVLAVGAVTNDFGIPGVADNALPLKGLADAVRLRNHLLRCFEEADADPSLVGRGWLNVVLVGGGPTGVEMAGALRELFTRVLAEDFPGLPVRDARVVLVEMADAVLPPFSDRSRRHAGEQLRRRGVEVLTGRTVVSAGAEAVELDGGERIPARTLVWAAGVKASSLPAAIGLQTGRGGRVVVAPDLSVRGRREVWIVGDAAAATDAAGALLPQVAQPAIQGGRHVAEQIVRRAAGMPTQPFTYRDKGSMATIGRHAAVADLPLGIRLSGVVGWWAWLLLHLVTLMGFRNRLSVVVNWAWNYVTWDRGARLLLDAATEDLRGPKA